MTSLAAQVRERPLQFTPGRTEQSAFLRFRLGVLLADLAVITFALWLGCEVRSRWWFLGDDGTGVGHLCLSYGPWMGLAWLGWMAARGCYAPRIFGAGSDEFGRVIIASFLTAGTVAMACYLSKFDLSRGFVCITFLFGPLLLLAERLAARRFLHWIRSNGGMQRRVLVVADPTGAQQIAEILHRDKHVGYTVVGSCAPIASVGLSGMTTIPNLGTVGDIQEIVRGEHIDAVLIASGPFADAPTVRETAWALEETHAELMVVPSLSDIAGPRVHVRPVAGLPLLHIERPQAQEAVRWGKRAFDLIGSLLLIILSIPIWAAVAWAIKADDSGPVLFRQQRVGLRGSTFDCLKFRSMHPQAEAMQHVLHDQNESDGVLFKIQADPRCTRVGRFIRRYSLDEIPQLVNVLRGEMSLVGPRPPLPGEVARYEPNVSRRLLVRPGMTGLWQVSGRSELSWRDSVRLDLYYVDNWSLLSDMRIILKTVRAVVRADGAA